MEYRNIIIRIARVLQLLLCFILVGCVNEFDATNENAVGFLKLSLASISTETETRSTPAELGKPLADQFKLRIVSSSGLVAYDDYYKDETLTIPVGNYFIEASYGNNPALGIDAPYYIGTASAEIQENQTTSVTIPCSVGNALVSARFGDPEKTDDAERFERYYSDYALYVFNGSNSIPITKEHPDYSVYLRAGSPVKLMFWGKLKMQDNREVSCEVIHKDLPKILSAADHLIVTLTLSDPESSVLVDISKVEIETVTLEETIPLSWLPVPSVTSAHHYSDQGILVGTDLTFTNSYPDMKWKVVVTNAAGDQVRTAMFDGSQNQKNVVEYTSSAEWPYLPRGTYRANYYLVAEGGTEKMTSSREFQITECPALSLTVSGYSSYSKYMEGDVEAANACNRSTVYEPSVDVNIDKEILAKYHDLYSYTCSFNGTEVTMAEHETSLKAPDQTGLGVRSSLYDFNASVTFDGGTVTKSKGFLITGLPVIYTPPTTGAGWVKGDGKVSFESEYVQLGHNSALGNNYIYNRDFYIPVGVKLALVYDFMLNIDASAIAENTFTISAGDNILFEETIQGSLLSWIQSIDRINTTSFPVVVEIKNDPITEIKCNQTYGLAQTYTNIRSLNFFYGQ